MRPHCDTNAKNEGSMRGAPELCYGGEEGVLSTDVTVAHLASPISEHMVPVRQYLSGNGF